MPLLGMLDTLGRALFASQHAAPAVSVNLGVRRAGGGAGAADVGADGAKVAVVDGVSRQRVHGDGADVGAVEVDQCAQIGGGADVGGGAGLAGVDGILAGGDAGVDVVQFVGDHGVTPGAACADHMPD